MTPQRRHLLETAIQRHRELAAQERSRMGAAGRDHAYSSTALKNADAHDRSADKLQAELDAGSAA